MTNRHQRRAVKVLQKTCQHRFKFIESKAPENYNVPDGDRFECKKCGHVATKEEIIDLAEKLKKFGLLKQNGEVALKINGDGHHENAGDSTSS